jgi:hypothetical protein
MPGKRKAVTTLQRPSSREPGMRRASSGFVGLVTYECVGGISQLLAAAETSVFYFI